MAEQEIELQDPRDLKLLLAKSDKAYADLLRQYTQSQEVMIAIMMDFVWPLTMACHS